MPELRLLPPLLCDRPIRAAVGRPIKPDTSWKQETRLRRDKKVIWRLLQRDKAAWCTGAATCYSPFQRGCWIKTTLRVKMFCASLTITSNYIENQVLTSKSKKVGYKITIFRYIFTILVFFYCWFLQNNWKYTFLKKVVVSTDIDGQSSCNVFCKF